MTGEKEEMIMRDGGLSPTLGEEHALLLAQVTERAEDVFAVTARGRWPEREVRALADFLRSEVIRQIREEEWLLLPSYDERSDLSRLARDHVRLRVAVDRIVRAAGDGEGCSPAQIDTATRDLLTQLTRHFSVEERVLAEFGPPATAALGGRPRGWYPLTEGPVIDLDALPEAQALQAVQERLRRLARDEQVELRSTGDPARLCWRLAAATRGEYGFTFLREGPDLWRVQILRRNHP